jgi:hypothetical protein
MPDDVTARLLARYRELDATPAPAPVPELVGGAVTVTATHARALDLLDELLALANAGKPQGPGAILLRGLHRARPMLLNDFARVPEDQVKQFLALLGAKLIAVGDPDADSRLNLTPEEMRANAELHAAG